MKGKIISVNISDNKGEKKHNIERCRLVEGHGLDDDAHAGPWHRQVSLLAAESIEKIKDMGLDVKPGDFAENLTTEGIELPTLPIGTKLQIGGKHTDEGHPDRKGVPHAGARSSIRWATASCPRRAYSPKSWSAAILRWGTR